MDSSIIFGIIATATALAGIVIAIQSGRTLINSRIEVAGDLRRQADDRLKEVEGILTIHPRRRIRSPNYTRRLYRGAI